VIVSFLATAGQLVLRSLSSCFLCMDSDYIVWLLDSFFFFVLPFLFACSTVCVFSMSTFWAIKGCVVRMGLVLSFCVFSCVSGFLDDG